MVVLHFKEALNQRCQVDRFFFRDLHVCVVLSKLKTTATTYIISLTTTVLRNLSSHSVLNESKASGKREKEKLKLKEGY